MAEKQREYQRRDGNELHHARNGNDRQRSKVRCDRQQHRGQPDEGTMATLTVSAVVVAPTITTQPSNQTVNVGQTATFTVTATGTAPLSYRVAEKTARTLLAATAREATPRPQRQRPTMETKFDVIVSNTAGSQMSTMATLTVNAVAVAPTITTQPSNQTVNVGQTATFSVTNDRNRPPELPVAEK